MGNKYTNSGQLTEFFFPNQQTTLKKSEHFISNFDEGIMERDGSSVCLKETYGNALNEGETEAANVHKTEDLDSQICHAESLQPENVLTKNDKTEHGLQRDQDLSLKTDRASNNTSNMSDVNLSIFGRNCVKINLKGTDIDEDALYGDMNGKTIEGLS